MLTAEDARKLKDTSPVELDELGQAIESAAKIGGRSIGSGDFHYRPLFLKERKTLIALGYMVKTINESGWNVSW